MTISRTDWDSLVARVQQNDPQLSELNFSKQKIPDPKYLETISTALRTNSHVVAMDLGTNPLTLDGLHALGSTLKTNHTLIKVILPEDYATLEIGKVADAVRTTLYHAALQSAQYGSAFAQYWVGYCDANGIGTTQNLPSALSWYEKSAAQQHMEGEYLLAVSLYSGLGTEPNRESAVKRFTKLAEKGHLGAMCSLVEHFTTDEKNEEQATFWCKKAADLGDATAQRFLGHLHMKEAKQIVDQLQMNHIPVTKSSVLIDVLEKNIAEQAHLTTPDQVLNHLNISESENKIRALESQIKSANNNITTLMQDPLNAELQELLAEHRVKKQKEATILAFQSFPNLWNHYRNLQISLENVFIGCKAVASEFIETSLTGKMTTAATALSFASRLAKLVPVVGNALDAIASGVSAGLEHADHIRQNNILKNMASLGSLLEIAEYAESTARRLTERYREQLEKLPTEALDQSRAEAAKAASTLGKVVEKGKEAIDGINVGALKGSTSTAAEKLADFAISQIVGALLDCVINSSNPLDNQFIDAVTTPPSRWDFIKQAISAKLGIGMIITTDGKPWQIEHVYRKPGIKSNGVYYSGGDTLPDLYGYRLGTEEEARTLGLTQEGQAAATPPTPAVNNTPAPIPTVPQATPAPAPSISPFKKMWTWMTPCLR